MPRIIFTVDEAERQLWVQQAHEEMVSLSEWLRRAARQRLGEAHYIKDTVTTVALTPDMKTGGNLSPRKLAVEEVVTARPPLDAPEVVLTTEPAASTARCSKERQHHIYHAGKPCPSCGFPNREV